jgi:hypothetical protein
MAVRFWMSFTAKAVEGPWAVGAPTALVRFPNEASLRAFWDSPENGSHALLLSCPISTTILEATDAGTGPENIVGFPETHETEEHYR